MDRDEEDEMKLYEVPPSPNCKKVRICAHELGIPFESVSVDPFAGQNRTPEYLGRNPMGKVPTIDDDGFLLWESGAILAYLAGKKPEKGLLPAEPRAHADTLRWMLWSASHVQPYLTALIQERRFKPMRGEASDPQVIAFAEKELARFLPVLDQQLKEHEYVTGRYSVADIAIGAVLEDLARFGLDAAPYPHIRAWVARLQAREAWKKATVG